jgi:hypothetical protein
MNTGTLRIMKVISHAGESDMITCFLMHDTVREPPPTRKASFGNISGASTVIGNP